MANAVRVWSSEVFEAGTKYLTARVVDKSGNVVVQGDFSGSGILKVYDLSTSTSTTPVYTNSSVSISGIVFDTLQTWDRDDEGYNLQIAVTSNNVAWEGGHLFRASLLLPHSSQGYIPVIWDLQVRDVLTL